MAYSDPLPPSLLDNSPATDKRCRSCMLYTDVLLVLFYLIFMSPYLKRNIGTCGSGPLWVPCNPCKHWDQSSSSKVLHPCWPSRITRRRPRPRPRPSSPGSCSSGTTGSVAIPLPVPCHVNKQPSAKPRPHHILLQSPKNHPCKTYFAAEVRRSSSWLSSSPSGSARLALLVAVDVPGKPSRSSVSPRPSLPLTSSISLNLAGNSTELCGVAEKRSRSVFAVKVMEGDRFIVQYESNGKLSCTRDGGIDSDRGRLDGGHAWGRPGPDRAAGIAPTAVRERSRPSNSLDHNIMEEHMRRWEMVGRQNNM